MPQVDFYILNTADLTARLNFLCRLIEKAYLKNHRIFVYCQDKTIAETLDEWLWTFQADSFIPHNLQGEGPTAPPPVQIGTEAPQAVFRDILLNLSESVPSFYSAFKRVIEVIDEDADSKTLGRARYRDYQLNACRMHTHPIDLLKPVKEPRCDTESA